MKNQVSNFTEFRKYYLSEYELYDGECFITFNLVGVDLDRNEIQVAVSDRGRISVIHRRRDRKLRYFQSLRS